MSQPDDQLLAEIPGLTRDTLRHARNAWTPQATMRQVIEIRAKQKIEAERNALENCTADELPKHQARIACLREFKAVIAAEFKFSPTQ